MLDAVTQGREREEGCEAGLARCCADVGGAGYGVVRGEGSL